MKIYLTIIKESIQIIEKWRFTWHNNDVVSACDGSDHGNEVNNFVTNKERNSKRNHGAAEKNAKFDPDFGLLLRVESDPAKIRKETDEDIENTSDSDDGDNRNNEENSKLCNGHEDIRAAGDGWSEDDKSRDLVAERDAARESDHAVENDREVVGPDAHEEVTGSGDVVEGLEDGVDGEVVDEAEEGETDVHKEVQIELEVGDVRARLCVLVVRRHLENQDQTDV